MPGTKARGGCGRWALYGVIGLVALMACGVVSNLISPRTKAPEQTSRSAAVSLPTFTATPEVEPTEPPPTEVAPTQPPPTQAPPTNTPVPTAVPPTATSVPAATSTVAAPAGPVANSQANVREGPGTEYAVMAVADPGQAIVVTGKDSSGEWLQLGSGYWISTALVDNAPVNLPVTAAAAQPAAGDAAPVPTTAPTTVAQQSEPGAAPFTCVGGCAEPQDGCDIKGNVNSDGERIYHAPGDRDYKRTDIKPEEGDRWFCTAAEAEAAGFRAPQN